MHSVCSLLWIGFLFLLLSAVAAAQPTVWVVDPLVKVFRPDAPEPGAARQIALQAARGEYESAQVCVRGTEAIAQLEVVAGDLVGPAGRLPATAITWNPVGYVPLTTGTPAPPSELCCQAPTDVPDPLLPPAPIQVEADQTQPLWVTVHVPTDAAAGGYSGRLTMRWHGGEAAVPLSLTVWPFAMPAEQHLSFTNWIDPQALAKHHNVTPYSDEFFTLLARYARAANEHYQNVMWVGLDTVPITEAAGGTLGFDWSVFDRWVEVVTGNGCGRWIEIQPLGHWADGWGSTAIALHGYQVRGAGGDAKAMSAEAVLPHLLPALQAHLEERGWVDRTLLHIADEPAVHHAASWREKSRWVHSLAPRLRRIDAIEGPDFGDDLEVWVPKLNHLYNWLPHYDRAREAGKEVWFYTCCHPAGVFPNRFLDQPLVKTRILQWYNWRYRLSGYLHWGLCAWTDDPFHSQGHPGLPPGDCWIVYPGEGAPLSSLRWEALRDGFEDYEYLWLLTDRVRAVAQSLGAPPDALPAASRADEFAHRLVPGMIDYCRDPQELRRTREEVAAEIAQLDAEPTALVVTDPPTSHTLASGPIVVETRVWTKPGATVKVNGAGAFQQPEGHWAHHTGLGDEGEVRVDITEGEATKTIIRRFRVVTERGD